MSLTKETIITIDVTPKLLRTIADKIERDMETTKIGQQVPFHVFCSELTTVKLQADQDAWHSHKQSNSRWA